MKSPAKACLLILSAFIAACAPVTSQPVVTPQPPPSVRLVQATIRGANHEAPDGTQVRLRLEQDGFVPLPCALVQSRAVCTLDARFPSGLFGAHLLVSAPQYVDVDQRIILTGASQDLPDVSIALVFTPLPRLVPVGRTLRQIDGTRWTAIEASDFNLYNRFLVGEDIEPVFTQRAGAGFTLLRVWTGYNVPGIGRLVPREHPDFYARLPEFLNRCASHRLYVELTAFTGPYAGIFNSDDEKVQHWERLIAAVRGNTGLAYLELVNEADNPPNLGLPFDRLRRPDGVLASHGSSTQDAMPVQPFWDVVTYRPAGGETWRKAGHNAGELTGFGAPPVLSNETQRAPDNDNDPNHFYDMAAGCVLLSAGCAFHSVHGKDSTLWQGDELRDAQAFGAGGRSVPLNCQDGNYENLGDIPPFLRVYRTGGLDVCRVEIR